MKKTIKIILAFLLFGCLAHLPYGYYQLVRIAGLVGFGVLAYMAYEQGNQQTMIIFIVLAILFQPIVKIALGREIWNVVDMVVGIGLLISLLMTEKQK
jgi:hypothetical protein